MVVEATVQLSQIVYFVWTENEVVLLLHVEKGPAVRRADGWFHTNAGSFF